MGESVDCDTGHTEADEQDNEGAQPGDTLEAGKKHFMYF